MRRPSELEAFRLGLGTELEMAAVDEFSAAAVVLSLKFPVRGSSELEKGGPVVVTEPLELGDGVKLGDSVVVELTVEGFNPVLGAEDLLKLPIRGPSLLENAPVEEIVTFVLAVGAWLGTEVTVTVTVEFSDDGLVPLLTAELDLLN